MAKRAHVPRPAGTPRRFERVVTGPSIKGDVFSGAMCLLGAMWFYSLAVMSAGLSFAVAVYSTIGGIMALVALCCWHDAILTLRARKVYYVEVRE